MPPSLEKLATISAEISAQLPPGQSAFWLSQTNREALEWRLMLTEQAQYRIDMQYFLWHNDMSGRLLLLRLLEAADRGVKIRLLVDDMPLETNADGNITSIDAHKNVDIKIFNPTSNRLHLRRFVEMITHAGKLNHRMHNKLIIVDEAAAIVGGRNIGDEYFGLNSNMNFVDLDALVFGPHVALASDSFNIYWHSKWSVDVKTLLGKGKATEAAKIQNELQEALAQKKTILAPLEIEPQSRTKRLRAVNKGFVPGTAISIQDDPSELKTKNMSIAGTKVDHIAESAKEELCISSPYFIPNKDMLQSFARLVDRGVNIRILTNSLMTNNHIAAHSGYIKFRKKVLQLGVHLFEMHHAANLRNLYDTPPVSSGILGLHAKTVIIDRKKVFIGSLNFDPRAIFLNSEMGLLIDSPELAGQVSQWFKQLIAPANSWRLSLTQNNKICWSSDLGEFTKEPMRDIQQKLRLLLLYMLPIEKQL